MSISAEIRAILERGNRKDIAGKLGLSDSRLSQWATGESLIPEAYLARLVESELPGAEDDKAHELLRLCHCLLGDKIKSEGENDKSRWTESSRKLAQLAMASAAVNHPVFPRVSGRTLQDFPGAFYPMAIVSGDKREDSESRITAADFGAVGASHAELRWLSSLGLKPDVELYGDKVFVLEKFEELKARFGDKHLLVVGSPGSNHLARRCLLHPPKEGWHSASPTFRFNLAQFWLQKIESFLESLQDLKTKKELVGKRAEESTERDMKHWLKYLFTGGIVDPTNVGLWIRGHEIPNERDYGLISLARNPFSDPEKPFFCILVAGFHLLGTAQALKMLASPKQSFSSHPIGGVIKVDIKTGLPFAKRFDESTSEWDDNKGYGLQELRSGLETMKGEFQNKRLAPTVYITGPEIDDCLDWMRFL